ncbi:MAG: heme ABC transporter ATP-binding protein [Rhizobiaceae bacterium]|nr:heme ABC transporter ATP-binding protein [Rhizobiaceae bacterium]
MIEARGVSVSIGRKRIIEGVDLRAQPGRITAIVGPNGSGKSTLLKALSGDLAHEGKISMHGRDIRTVKPHEAASMRAVLPQSTTLSFPFTVREVVRLGLLGGWSGVPAREAGRLPERALVRVDLDGFAGRFYQELSGGEQQRVQLARVLCQVWMPVLDGRPRYLFLDEPISSLDIRHQLAIMDVALDFARRGGGVLAVLHDLNLTAMYADSVYVMQRGRLAAAGAPAEVITDSLIARVFECPLRVGVVPRGVPFILPQTAGG